MGLPDGTDPYARDRLLAWNKQNKNGSNGEKGELMKTFGITATLPAQDLNRAKAFYLDKVGLQAVESHFLEAGDGRVGFAVGDGVNRLFVYPAEAKSSGEFTQAVLQVTDVRATVQEMRGRGRDLRGVQHRRDADSERHRSDA